MAGGAEIMFNGAGMSATPSDLTVMFQAITFPYSGPGTPVSSDNAFKSLTNNGFLQYTTPSLMDLHGVDYEQFGSFDTISYTMSLLDYDPVLQVLNNLYCSRWIQYACGYKVSRAYTPIMYMLSPPVVYQGSQTSFWVDPRSTQSMRQSTDLPFIEARINGYLIDFEPFVNQKTYLNAYSQNQIRGNVGHITPNNSATVNMKFLSGNALQMSSSMIRCDYSNSTCYSAKVVAVINSIDASTGYTTGGQLLTINGYGLNGQTTDIQVDGINCTVQSSTQTQITCLTSPQPNPSNGSSFVGQHGLRRKYYNTTYHLNQGNLLQSTDFTETLAMDMEAHVNLKNGPSGNIYSGFFKAPATASYRFYLACDDSCQLYLSNGSDPSQKQLVYSSSGWTTYRAYFTVDMSHVTTWFNFTQGQNYYLEVRHIQNGGGDDMTVSVEIQDPAIVPGHHNSMREIQRLFIDQTIQREQTLLTVNNPDSGVYILNILNPKTNNMWSSGQIRTNASSYDLYKAINGYYSSVFGVGISVTCVMYDVSNAITADSSLSVQNAYTITVSNSIAQASTTMIVAQSVSTQSIITIGLPSDVQLSNPPLAGCFQIQCAISETEFNYTTDIPATSSLTAISNAIISACPNYREKFIIWDGPKYSNYQDGRDILIRFAYLNQDIPQMQIMNLNETVQLIGKDLVLNSTTFIPYGANNLFYEPIPFEFLFTNESQPQVIVNFNGIPAVCASLSCGYTYTQPLSSITGFSISGNTLSITGINLTTSIQSVSLANVACIGMVITSTTISCSVTQVAGSWQPVVTDNMGIIPVTTTTTINVPLIVTSLAPSMSLNPMGTQTLHLTGGNFPPSLGTNVQMQLKFTGGSFCNVMQTSSTLITCSTTAFVDTATSILAIQIYNITDSSQTVQISSSAAVVSLITPQQVSPVLKSVLTLNLTGFPNALVKSDLQVTLVSKTNPSIIIKVNIIEVGNNNGNQYLKVKFGGADSGPYNVFVTSLSYGSFNSTGIVLLSIGTVTSFSPQQGSYNGGTLITINGYVFSNISTDNPVQIGYTDCIILSTSKTVITCRTLARLSNVGGVDEFMVFLQTSEQATCGVTPCSYTWVDSTSGLPAMTSYSADFNTTLNDYVLTISGSGFGATLTNTQVLIDNIVQSIISANDTVVQVQIVSILSNSTLNIQFYLPIGIPDGTENMTLTTGITLNPQFLSVTPNVGSPAGSMIIASVKGVGPQTQGVTLVTATGYNICSSVSIPQYGVIQCTTIIGTILNTQLSVQVGSNITSCIGSSSICSYQTQNSMPIVTQVNLSSTSSLTLTGTGFLIQGFNANVLFAGNQADSVIIASNVSLMATFNNGVPISQVALKPIVYFMSASSNITHWAQVSASLTTNMTVTSIDSSVSCSFAGGCLVSISQPGLLSTFTQNSLQNQILVCSQVCQIQSQASSINTTQCLLPPLPTSYSIKNYNISATTYIVGGTTFSSNSQQTKTVFDGVNYNGWNDTSANCSFGMSFRLGYVGFISEVKYFMNAFLKSNFVGNLQFQASNDGKKYTTIFIVGQEIHEGWNYYNFAPGKELQYRFYRFFGTAAKSCMVGEVAFRGIEIINAPTNQFHCGIQLNLNGTVVPLAGSIIYQSNLTSLLTSISPRFGTVVGGDQVTFIGVNLSLNIASYTILIDNRTCAVVSATTTSVVCTTSSRPGLYPSTSLSIKIAGQGNVATQGLLFRYCSYWSDDTTWGGEAQPIAGDMIYIPPGLHLLVDVDSTPILSAVLVEGSLIFAPNANPNYQKYFDANYIMVDGGYMEVGTEDFPYTSKLTITMHSNKQSPEIPIFGNKVIAVMNGVLDMHGVPRHPTWTQLAVTSLPTSNTITLITAVDWQVGESIIIAPTGYNNNEGEEKIITSIDRSNPQIPIITLDSPLKFKHYSGRQTFGNQFIEMRAEVGLLTRNVVYRGDPETSALNQFGAHIMLHSAGDESLIGRIQYIELRDVGQAFQLGRYPIHFHLIGTVSLSYIQGNSIHQSYNRAITLHGVHYLRVLDNVAYNILGHTYFVEDAVETNNLIQNNLAILTKKSWSLLNTDIQPASFWITHPDNILKGNHAVGSDNYGFWFDPQTHPTGPSFDPNVCPQFSKLGEFSNNVAHSNGWYGLRIFHQLVPLTNPCSPLIYDPTNTTDPYWQNPIITAQFINFTSYMNVMNGAIGSYMGPVQFINFKVADNLIAGIEYETTSATMDGTAMINGALVIGRSDNADITTNTTASWGIITPRTENFQVHNVSFYNFDVANKSALGSCSHCFFPDSTDSGARTVTFSKLYFDSSVLIKIRYQEPWRDIFYDLDGTLTGLGPKTWATPYYKHNDQPECQTNMYVMDGLICNSSVQLRRVVFFNWAPYTLAMMDMKIIQWDDKIINTMSNTTLASYINDTSQYSVVKMTLMTDPSYAWAVPYVTGHKYKLHYQYGIDFTRMEAQLSQKWTPTDLGVTFEFNFTTVRAKVDFITGPSLEKILNTTMLGKTSAQLQTGDNVVYNDTATRMIQFYANGINMTRNPVTMMCYQCIGSCLPGIQTVPISDIQVLWSDPQSWPSGAVPIEGENVEIIPGANFIYDLPVSPLYNQIQINGRVTFQQEAPKLHLRAMYMFVREGELLIGNQSNPYLGDAQIILSGQQNSQTIVFANAIVAGNKVLANTNKIAMYGQRRSQFSRLVKTAQRLDTSIVVGPGLDWTAGDKIGLAPTAMYFNENDYAVIVSYDPVTGVIMLDRPLNNYHYGDAASTGSSFSGVDMRGEVVLLTRNIKIVGNDTESWGCQILTSDYIDTLGEMRNGSTVMDSVEIYNCSQYDTQYGALRFEYAQNAYSQISNSALHHGLGVGTEFQNAANVLLVNNTYFSFVRYTINIRVSRNITLDGNILIGTYGRHYSMQTFSDSMAAIGGCGEANWCSGIKIVNNIVSGVESSRVDTTAYSVMAHECGDYSTIVFKNNTAHSIDGHGAIIFKNAQSPWQGKCMEASYFTAYKCSGGGIISYDATNMIVFSNMILIDNYFGASPMIGQEGDNLWAIMKNMVFHGEAPTRDCPSAGYCLNGGGRCWSRSAIMLPVFTTSAQPPLQMEIAKCPHEKITSSASFGGQVSFYNITFVNFTSDQTYCGSSQKLFIENPFSADYTPQVILTNTKFINIDQDAMAYLFDPPNVWANTDDCGNFPCTGPSNVLISFQTSSYAGPNLPLSTSSDFQIISAHAANTGQFFNCKLVKSWNAYYCTNSNLGVLLFESLDGDSTKRTVTPITVFGVNTNATNVLNTMMDHQWDGFYTSHLRMSRFPALIQMGNNYVQEIQYTGTPPNSQRFSLRQQTGSVIVRIRYPKTGTYIIQDYNGKSVTANSWDDSLQAAGAIKGDNGGFCGENRYQGVVNILEFYLTRGCNVTIMPIDSIQTTLRLNWTLPSFYAAGGTTKFVSRLAAVLGIKAANIKIVSVYMGSVIIDSVITEDSTGTISKIGGMAALQETLTQLLTVNKIDFGAPIISFISTFYQATVNAQATTSSGTNTQTNNIPVLPGAPTSNQVVKSPVVTVVQATQQSSNTTVIVIICVIIVVVIISIIAGYFLIKRFKNNQGEHKAVVESSIVSSAFNTNSGSDEVYEEQYHPNAGNIFDRNDQIFRKGNEADDIIEEADEISEGDDDLPHNIDTESKLHGVDEEIGEINAL